MKVAYIIRGLPGSGKTTLAKEVAPEYNIAADDWFDKFNDGIFDPKKLKMAHDTCAHAFKVYVDNEESPIAVHNTFTRISEYQWYKEYAEQNGYTVFVITVENRHGNISTHGVPSETMEKMKNRFELTL